MSLRPKQLRGPAAPVAGGPLYLAWEAAADGPILAPHNAIAPDVEPGFARITAMSAAALLVYTQPPTLDLTVGGTVIEDAGYARIQRASPAAQVVSGPSTVKQITATAPPSDLGYVQFSHPLIGLYRAPILMSHTAFAPDVEPGSASVTLPPLRLRQLDQSSEPSSVLNLTVGAVQNGDVGQAYVWRSQQITAPTPPVVRGKPAAVETPSDTGSASVTRSVIDRVDRSTEMPSALDYTVRAPESDTGFARIRAAIQSATAAEAPPVIVHITAAAEDPETPRAVVRISTSPNSVAADVPRIRVARQVVETPSGEGSAQVIRSTLDRVDRSTEPVASIEYSAGATLVTERGYAAVQRSILTASTAEAPPVMVHVSAAVPEDESIGEAHIARMSFAPSTKPPDDGGGHQCGPHHPHGPRHHPHHHDPRHDPRRHEDRLLDAFSASLPEETDDRPVRVEPRVTLVPAKPALHAPVQAELDLAPPPVITDEELVALLLLFMETDRG